MPTLATLYLFDANGAPVDAPIAVTLTDATNTYGIRRDRDNAVILAPGAATSHPSVGVYTYDYAALGLDSNESYLLSFKYNTTSFLPVALAATRQGVSLRDAMRSLAERMGAYFDGVTGVQIAPPTGAYTGTAIGTDAPRMLVSSDFTDADVSGVFSDLDKTLLEGVWAYIPAAGVASVRRIAAGSFVPYAEAGTVTDLAASTVPVGYFHAGRPWPATLPPGLTFQIYRFLPPVDARHPAARGRSLLRCINDALAKLRTVTRLTLTGTGQQRQSLAAYPWITSIDQLAAVYDTDPGDGDEASNLVGGGELRKDGATVYLVTPSAVSLGSTFTVDLYRPANTWIRVGGTWADSTVGLQNETDEADVEPGALTLLAYWGACDALARRDPLRGFDPYWTAARDEVAGAAGDYLVHQQPTVATPRRAGLTLSGGRR